MTGNPDQPPIRPDVSHSARVWNYWLGGKDNYTVDREVGDQILSFIPELANSARADRDFLARAVRFLVSECGIRQFLDIGTGLPTANNTHQVAQGAASECRIVYVDNDPLVLVHARALLTSAPEGATDYIEADVHDPETILAGAAKTLDFNRPVAITMLGILNFVLDDDKAQAIIDTLVDAVPSGSYLAISHPTYHGADSETMRTALEYWNENSATPMRLRTPAELEPFFRRTELVDPGIVSCTRWRPPASTIGEIMDVHHFCGVARRP